jgi:predicted flap endonuclease-1-like 5' DNA nuclease
MTTLLYLLVAALAFFVIGYLLAKIGCGSSGERYLSETPVDPVTEDDKSCEDAEINARKERAAAEERAKAAEAQRLLDEEAAAKAKVEEEAEAARKAEAQAKKAADVKAAQEKAAKETKAKEEAEAKAKAVTPKAAEAKVGQKKATKETKSQAKEKGTKAKKAVTAKTAIKKDSDTVDANEDKGVAPEGLLSAPREGGKDNLTRIKGIGIKIDAALNGIGFYHYDQIAVWTEENMAWADSQLAFPGRAKRDDWVGQAKLLAEGKETAFSKRVDKGEVSSSKKA